MMARPLSEELALINHFRNYAPVNVDLVAHALGLRVAYVPLDDDVSGMLEKAFDGTFVITVNSTHPKTRQRFTIAHELGHYIHHRSHIGDGISDSKAYRSTRFNQYVNSAIGPRQEAEANRFAADLLMPVEAVERMKSQLRVNDPERIADILGVSVKAYKIRFGINENDDFNLSVKHSMLGS